MIYRFYQRPTFISGLASLFDLYNAKKTQKVYLSYSDDFKLIANDFNAAGLDLKKAINNYTLDSDVNNKKVS
jgi:hypothetical protein